MSYSFQEAMMEPVRNPALSMDALLANRGWVRALAMSLVRDEHRADDLVQQTWLRALQSPPTRVETVQGWLATIVRNLARDGWRRDGRRAAREASVAHRDALPATADLVARAEAHRSLIRHVTELREPYRTVVLLRFFEELPPREIAIRLGLPAATVRTRLHRALGMLRETLERQDDARGSWELALLPLPAAALGKSASSTASALIGGLVVTTKQKIATAAVLLLLLCGGAAYVASTLPGGGPEPEEVAVAPTNAPDNEVGETREREHIQPETRPETAAEAAVEEVVAETPVALPPARAMRAALTFTVLRHVPPRQVPKGYTELLPGEEPVIEDPGTAMGGGRGPRLLPYWSRWAPVPEKGTVTIRGRVTDASGRGLEGAEVYRVKLDENGQRASPSSYQWNKEIAKTDATGFFEATEQPAGDFLIAADFRAAMRRSRGLDVAPAVPISAVENQTLPGVDITLPVETARFGSVRGVVLNEKGEPQKNAEVWGPMQRIYTDKDGRFEMGGLQPGVTAIAVRATGYAPVKLNVDLAPGGAEDVEVHLEFAEQGDLTLEGRVVDEDGAPIRDAKVFLAASRGGSRWATTDASGVFRFERMDAKYAEQAVKVMVSPHPDRDLFKPLGPPVQTTVPAPGLELVVQRTTRVHVLLRDEETDEPLPLFAIDCQIQTTIDGETDWRTFHSTSRHAEDGEAVFSVPEGRFRLTIRAKDHRGVEIEIDVPDTDGPKEIRVPMKRE